MDGKTMKRNRDLEATEELNSMYAYAYELKEAIFHLYETRTVNCERGLCHPCNTRTRVFNEMVQERLSDR